MSYEILDHTGDVGLRYFGTTVEELFSSAVEGTAFLIGEFSGDCRREELAFRFSWTDLADLMYQVLDRIIYEFEVDELLVDRVLSMDYADRGNTEIIVSGCHLDETFSAKYIMKAPTYHQMVVDPEKGYGIQIFDI